jgi:hypothetical protein
MLSKEPKPTPSFDDTFSVAYVRRPVNGTIAKAFKAKTKVLFRTPAVCAPIPNGTKMSKMLSQERANTWRTEKAIPFSGCFSSALAVWIHL